MFEKRVRSVQNIPVLITLEISFLPSVQLEDHLHYNIKEPGKCY